MADYEMTISDINSKCRDGSCTEIDNAYHAFDFYGGCLPIVPRTPKSGNLDGQCHLVSKDY